VRCDAAQGRIDVCLQYISVVVVVCGVGFRTDCFSLAQKSEMGLCSIRSLLALLSRWSATEIKTPKEGQEEEECQSKI